MKLFLNGGYYHSSEASVAVFDRAFLFGDGVFTTIRVENLVPLFLAQHISRLQASCHFFGIEFIDPGLAEIIAHLLKENGLCHARVKIIVSRGADFHNQIFTYPTLTPTVAVLVFPFDSSPHPPLRLCRANEVRGTELIYQHKTTSYLPNLQQKTKAREQGFDDCVILNWEKWICETTTANLFFITGKRIITPPETLPLLNGIMRQNILAQKMLARFQVSEEHLSWEDLKHVEGVFATSAILEVCPVERIDQLVFSLEKSEMVRNEWQRLRCALVDDLVRPRK